MWMHADSPPLSAVASRSPCIALALLLKDWPQASFGVEPQLLGVADGGETPVALEFIPDGCG
jgi:hypothetical protein